MKREINHELAKQEWAAYQERLLAQEEAQRIETIRLAKEAYKQLSFFDKIEYNWDDFIIEVALSGMWIDAFCGMLVITFMLINLGVLGLIMVSLMAVAYSSTSSERDDTGWYSVWGWGSFIPGLLLSSYFINFVSDHHIEDYPHVATIGVVGLILCIVGSILLYNASRIGKSIVIGMWIILLVVLVMGINTNEEKKN